MALIQVTDIARTYQQGSHEVKALRGVDLEIESGEFMALMGPSGSGKTTLLNLIGGLDTPTTGKVEIEGTDISALTGSALSDLRRDRVGFVFQAYNLVPVLSAAENAEMVLVLRGDDPSERRAKAMKTLEEVGLSGKENRRPAELSGGEQQRVAVARAITGEPALVLADEPTANLDSTTGTELIALMRKLNQDKGVTFVFATHDPKVMEAADRVVRMVDGKIVSDDRR
jgi:putative ABC transport system ATP-binding protein